MPKYTVTLPDGTSYNVEAPAGTSQTAIQLAAQRFAAEEQYRAATERLNALRSAPPPPPEPPKTTIGGNVAELFKGLIPGTAGFVETAGTGLSALLPEGAEQATRQGLKAFRETVSAPFAAAPGYEESVTRKLSEGLGSTLPFFALGPAGILGRIAGAGLGAAAGAGEARIGAEAKGATGSERALATALGTPVGLLDMLAPNMGRVKSVLGKELGTYQSMMTTALARGGVEGATEAAQKIAQNLIARGVYDPNQPLFEGSGEEGAYGAGVGALASLIIDNTIGRKAYRPAATPSPAQPPAAPPVTQPPGVVPPSSEFPQGELFSQDLSSVRQQRAQPEPRPEFELTSPAPEEGRQLELRFGEPAPVAQPGQLTLEEGVAERERTEAHRAQILRTIMEEPSVQNVPETFSRALAVAGYDTAPTEQERAMMREPTQTVIPGTEPAQSAPTAPTPEQPEPAAETKLTPELLDRTGLPRQSAFYRQLVNKDMADPAQQAQVRDVLVAVRSNPNLTPATKQAVERVAMQAFNALATQGEMFGPQGEVTAPAPVPPPPPAEPASTPPPPPPTEPPSARAETQAQGIGAGAPSVGAARPSAGVEPAAAPSAPGVATPEPAGLGAGAPPAPRPDVRKEPVPVAVEAPVAPAATFKTALGSSYSIFPDGTTQREKAARDLPGHEGDKGPKERSARTIYFDKNAAPLSAAGVTMPEGAKPRVVLKDGTATLTWVVNGKRGSASGGTKVPFFTEPAVGRFPLELWQSRNDVPGYEAYAGMHAGNKIVELTAPAPAPAPASAPAPSTAPPTKAKKAKKPVSPDSPEAQWNAMETIPFARLPKVIQKQWVQAVAEKKATGERAAQLADDAAIELGDPNNKVIDRKKFDKEVPEGEQTKYGLNLENSILGMGLHPAVQGKLAAGDLRGALEMVGELQNDKIATLAKRLAENIGETKITLSNDVKDERGQQVAGRFDPETNTITLNTATGMTGHVLLHEAVHAVTSHTLANPSHPLTKQLSALFEQVKPYIDTAYGARSLDEFVAEALSNPRFQTKLQGIPMPDQTTAFQRFARAVQNFVRRLFGMDAKPVESVLDAVDRLTYDLMAPAPQFRGAGSLYAAAATGNAKRPIDIYGQYSMAAPTWSQRVKYAWDKLLNVYGKGALTQGALSITPLNALVDLSKNRIPMADQLLMLDDLKSGSESQRNQKIEAVIKHASNWAAANRDKVDTFNSVVSNSTYHRVDPSKSLDTYSKYWMKVAPEGKPVRFVSFETADARKAEIDRLNKEATDQLRAKGDPKAVAKVARAFSDPDRDKVAVWKMLAPKWQALGEDGRGVYKQIRDTYVKLTDEIEQVIYKRVDDSLPNDKKKAAKIKKDIYERIFESGRIDPYFPLTRSGSYWLAYNYEGEAIVQSFDTPAMREDMIKELEAREAAKHEDPEARKAALEALAIEKFANISEFNYRKAPSTSLVNKMLQTLEAGKIDADAATKENLDKTIESVMTLFVNVLPETSFAKSFKTRKDRLGFEEDAISALQKKGYNISRQIANFEFGPKFSKLRDDIRDHVRAGGSKEDAVVLMDELHKRIDYAISPNIHWASKVATSVLYGWTLGFNVSSAVVSVAQLPVVVYPYLMPLYGVGETTKAIGRAMRTFSGSGIQRNVEMLVPVYDDKGKATEKSLRTWAAPSLDNYDFDDPKNKDIAHLKTLVTEARKRGQLNRSMDYEILGANEGDSVLNRVNKAMGVAQHIAERMNREVTLAAVYELELNRLKDPNAKLEDGRTAKDLSKQDKEIYAANRAIYLTELTNGGVSATSTPRIAQNSIGRVLFMYKKYGAQMYYLMFKGVREAYKTEDPAIRKRALQQLAAVQSSALLMAGVKGTTLYGIAAFLYDLLLADDDEDAFDTASRKALPEWAFSGLLNATFGIEISGRVGLSDLLFREPPSSSQNTGPALLIETFGGPLYGVVDRVWDGYDMMREGHFRRGIEKMLPAALSNLSKAERFGTEGALTLRGDPVTAEFGAGQVLGQLFGFAPAEYIRTQEINQAKKRIDRAVNEERSDLLRKYYIALRMGDTPEAEALVEKFQDFNRRHPTFPITGETVRNSVAQHIRTTQQMDRGILISKSMRPEIMQSFAMLEEDEDEE